MGLAEFVSGIISNKDSEILIEKKEVEELIVDLKELREIIDEVGVKLNKIKELEDTKAGDPKSEELKTYFRASIARRGIDILSLLGHMRNIEIKILKANEKDSRVPHPGYGAYSKNADRGR